MATSSSSPPSPPTSPTPPPALAAEVSPHRRRHSEVDMPSLRRVSEALLLAQNRARLATERANRSERVLRLVLTHVNPQLALSIRGELDGAADSMADWDMMQSTAVPTPRRHSLDGASALVERREVSIGDDDDAEYDGALWASVIAPERNADVALQAKEIVDNLHAAAERGHQRVQKLNASMPSGATFVAGRAAGQRSSSSRSASKSTALVRGFEKNTNWLETWKHRLFRLEIYALTPLQFVAGLLLGVVVGVTATKQMLRRQGGPASQLAKRLAACTENPRDLRAAALRYMPFAAMEEDMSSYYLHQAAVEVA